METSAMSSLFKRLLPVVLCGGAFLGGSESELGAQVRVDPQVGNQPAASTRVDAAQVGAANVARAANRPVAVGYNRPVGGYYPYGGGVYPGYGNTIVAQTPANGYLTGAASVINAQADYMQS